jgi:DNA polymerase III alpha subunit
MKEEDATWINATRGNGYFSIHDVWRRAGISPNLLARLAEADVFFALGCSRREALWEAKSIKSHKPLPLFSGDLGDEFINEPTANLPIMTTGEEIIEDYAALRFSLRAHPIALLRSYLTPVH